MFLKKTCIRSHAQLFLVDSAVIDYKIRSCYAALQPFFLAELSGFDGRVT